MILQLRRGLIKNTTANITYGAAESRFAENRGMLSCSISDVIDKFRAPPSDVRLLSTINVG